MAAAAEHVELVGGVRFDEYGEFIDSSEVGTAPTHQGQGIGSELVRRMLDTLKAIYMIDLICDPDVQPFYERLGMIWAKLQGKI